MNLPVKNHVGSIIAGIFRRCVLSWLLAVTVAYLRLPAEERELAGLEGLRAMSMGWVLAVTLAMWVFLTLAERYFFRKCWERSLLVGISLVLVTASVMSAFTWPFLILGLLTILAVAVYGRRGWEAAPRPMTEPMPGSFRWRLVAFGLSAAFFLFVSLWTVCRVRSFSAPTYDFGIFSQMFRHMKVSGLPMTTLERDGLLSHFAVHVSPIYYLLLPFYWLAPVPETLQILQAAVITSAVIPLWKLGEHHGLKDWQRMLLCAVLLLYPAFAGGTGYDIHENCFLTPLVLWLFYGIDRKKGWLIAAAAVLTLLVKEDAAVYVSVVGLYLLVRTALHWERGSRKELLTALLLILGALTWFALVTGYLTNKGDGVMSNRYENFIYDDSGSLLTVIEAVLLCPMKVLYESVDEQKLRFLGLTLLPLLGLPLLTRRYERYILLIPYILVNLMPDYRYQHDIFFQYTFGSAAFLIYLTLVNLQDVRCGNRRTIALLVAVAVSAGCFAAVVVPKAWGYVSRCVTYADHYDRLRQTLSLIPEDAPVSATTFYTTALSQREIVYDVRYSSWEHLMQTDYIALAVTEEGSYRAYGGFDELVKGLERNGYTLYAQIEGVMVIYYRPDSG